MTHLVIRRAAFTGFALLSVLSGCSRSDTAAEASRPAVISAAPPAPPKPGPVDTTDMLQQRIIDARTETAASYAVSAFASIGNDRRMLAAIYPADATLTLADSTYRGVAAVMEALISFAHRNSMADLVRKPVKTVFLKDSIVADSGTYVITSKREGSANVATQHGAYGAEWRMQPQGKPWLLVNDRMHPLGAGAGPKPPAKVGAVPKKK